MAHFDINHCFNSPYNWSFSPVTPVSSTNKTVHRDIIKILLKVALNTIMISLIQYCALLGLCQFWVVYIYIFITYFVAIYSFLHVQQLKVSVGYLPGNTFKYPYLPSYIRICPRIQLPVSAQWSQRLYIQVQRKMMHKGMHNIVFQSN